MTRKWQHLIVFALCALSAKRCLGQATRFATIEIEWENGVNYFADTSDPSRLATSATMVSPSTKNFMSGTAIADIVSVNGRPAKGTWIGRAQLLMLFPVPMPGQAVGDIGRPVIGDIYIEILQDDGTRVGTITGFGSPVGPSPVGTPQGLFGNLAVTGGTGAFAGARGFMTGPPYTFRAASMQEDPANRRTHGGGRGKYIVYLLPLSWPEIVDTPAGPAVFHADFSPVTSTRPARAGETLVLMAASLGPTRPGLSPGTPFPHSPFQEVNSPLELTVNGRPAELLNKIGWPGTTDNYRIDIRVPEGIPAGTATLQIYAGFITGGQTSIPIE